MQSRASIEAWIIGRGSCGKGRPERGASRQTRQARISRRSLLKGAGISPLLRRVPAKRNRAAPERQTKAAEARVVNDDGTLSFARSEATKQSIRRAALDCFASLAMMGRVSRSVNSTHARYDCVSRPA